MKVIQMGIGGMGNTWLKTVLASDEVEYAAFVEVNDTIAAEQVEQYDLEGSLVFRTLEEALAAVDADGVLDITPPQFHCTNAITAMEAGVPIMSEKPLSDTLEDAEAIVAKSNETGVLHMVSQDYRYKEPIQALKALLDSGKMGAVGAVNINYSKALHFTGFRRTLPYPFTIDMSIHHFDLMRFLLGSNARSLRGNSWNLPWSEFDHDSSTATVIVFENNVKVSYTGTWSGFGQETDWNANWRFDCANGSITMTDNVITTQEVKDTLEYGYSYYDVETVKIPDLTYARQAWTLHEFYEAVTTGKRPVTTCQDNIHSLRMVFNSIEAFESGEMVMFS